MPNNDAPQTATNPIAAPPVAKQVPHTRTFHGREFVDNYEWLREKDSPEVRQHLEAENAWTVQQTAHLKPLQDRLFEEVKARVQETDMSLPVRSGGWWYFSRTEEGKSYGTMCRVPIADKDDWTPPTIEPGTPAPGEETFLDCNALAEGKEFFSLGAASVTQDGTRLAYSVDETGSERFTLRVRDLTTGEDLEDEIEDVFYGATWVGRDTVYYQRVDEAWRPHEIWRHKIGEGVDKDELVYREDDERFWSGVATTRSERYLLIHTGSKVTGEVWYLDLEDPNAELTCVIPRESDVEYAVDHAVVGGQDLWLVLHNKTGANCELGYHPTGQIASWDDVQALVPHREDARLESVDVFSSHIVLEARENALETSYIMKLGDAATSTGDSSVPAFGEFERIEFSGELCGVGAVGNSEWESPVLRVAYTAFTTPPRIYEIDLETGEKILRKEQQVLADPDGREFDPTQYTSQRLWVTAEDGARIPVSLIHRTDVDVTQPNPVLLYGYGSYENCIDPGFSLFRLSMLDRGVVYAIAHVRGGGEMGRLWYDHGKGLEKRNTFTDFVAVADHLLREGMTTREQMVAEGGSAGGMLMGAVANMAGDRFAGIEAVVPFVDPLTSMLMPELPLTVTEWDEWGDPFHDPEVYDYMAGYAPYENVSADLTYPPILAVTSLNDTRVLYVEPAKWVAKLREVGADKSGDGADNPRDRVLLHIDMEAGHGGVSGRYAKWRQAAFETAWELDKMGATELLG